LGSVRRARLLTTYGVGSLIALGEQSFVVSGLDSWAIGPDDAVREARLERRLGVRSFRPPPSADPPAGDGVRVRRFPEMYSCPGPGEDGEGCRNNLRPFTSFGTRRGGNACAACGEALTPSRFVVACTDGHLDDFPYWEWVHNRTTPTSEVRDHALSIRTTGRSATLRSIVVSCSCGKAASMEGAFGRDALREIGLVCRGGRPWLGAKGRERCSLVPRTLQRGSSAAWYPVLGSALSIPPFSRDLYRRISGFVDQWIVAPDDVVVRMAEAAGVIDERYTAEDVLAAVHEYRRFKEGDGTDPTVITGFEPADRLRSEEYRALSRTAEDGDFVCHPADDEVPPPTGIDRTMLVTRLREVRALQTFTRVDPPIEGDPSSRNAALSLEPVDWLPAVEVIGEGVFLRLDTDRIAAWESPSDPHGPTARARRIRDHHSRVLAQRASDPASAPRSPVDARLVLVHSLAHALINEWSLDSGYPASALRERLYVSDEMAGVLIYTATSDSAGSLGGLVAQGGPERLQSTLAAALRRASWCSADPLCMEAEASGTDSLNLAACHACLLLPETSCEQNNSFLDRASLVGTPDGRTKGFFC
jgi:hypothetical protein